MISKGLSLSYKIIIINTPTNMLSYLTFVIAHDRIIPNQVRGDLNTSNWSHSSTLTQLDPH